MGLVVVLLLLALLIGGVGLLVEGLKWLLIIALVLLVVGFFSGYRSRSGLAFFRIQSKARKVKAEHLLTTPARPLLRKNCV